eukprot:m.39758 g.39758  ORF g.39758 m.39758 type:complete len:74 (+) comp14746_c0_seq1:1434-1655(+)
MWCHPDPLMKSAQQVRRYQNMMRLLAQRCSLHGGYRVVTLIWMHCILVEEFCNTNVVQRANYDSAADAFCFKY